MKKKLLKAAGQVYFCCECLVLGMAATYMFLGILAMIRGVFNNGEGEAALKLPALIASVLGLSVIAGILIKKGEGDR